ncbi:MAG: hypothetical protein CMO61_09910 [Verrucomicrobiales bacterium]|nr:hypothetical protein [Verrucomicrobiales bacterium]|tara:strand:+ start:8380 stop:8949 length:570 start_codon:yes stop_codon:yes gene_type:complete
MEDGGSKTCKSSTSAKSWHKNSLLPTSAEILMLTTSDHLQAFVSTYQSLFLGEEVPAMPTKPEDLSMTISLAMRERNTGLWQNMFGGHGAPLPADVQQRLLTGKVNPEDASALRAAHMDAYAAEADKTRESIIERSREATRAREKAQYEAERARHQQFNEASLLERLAASPLSDQAIAQARAQWGITGE